MKEWGNGEPEAFIPAESERRCESCAFWDAFGTKPKPRAKNQNWTGECKNAAQEADYGKPDPPNIGMWVCCGGMDSPGELWTNWDHYCRAWRPIVRKADGTLLEWSK